MTTSEALTHRFLACDPIILRRRENIRYNSTRLRKTYDRTLRRLHQIQQQNNYQPQLQPLNLSKSTNLNKSSSTSTIPVIPLFKGGVKS